MPFNVIEPVLILINLFF